MIRLINLLQELKFDSHYLDRKQDRVINIEKVIIPKEALGNYTLPQIQEPLITAVRNSLLTKLSTLEKGDLPRSLGRIIGYKIFTPLVLANGKRYPINIITSQGSGTYYYLVIKDETIYTIIVSTEEDLYAKIKDHIKRKRPEDFKKDTPIELMSYKDGIELFDLAKLMGEERVAPKKISKEDLPYTVRTDYRIGANFDHKDYGTGKIVATSTGNAGKADQRGMLAWVDVDFGKLYLSGGKLTKIRRINNVYAKSYFIPIPDVVEENKEVKSIEFYQQALKNVNVSPSTYKLFQDVINSVKKQNGKATEKQWDILQRIKTGIFKPSTKN